MLPGSGEPEASGAGKPGGVLAAAEGGRGCLRPALEDKRRPWSRAMGQDRRGLSKHSAEAEKRRAS